MSADVAIDEWLHQLGFDLPQSRAAARTALEQLGLTRPGKLRLSQEKLSRAEQALAAQFFRHCPSPACVAAGARSGRTPLPTADKSRCEGCGGSDNQRVARQFATQFAGKKLCVVGGSPAVFGELERLLQPSVDLRLVDGTTRRTFDQAKGDLEWADLVLLWGATELHHKVSTHYSTAPPPLRRKVVHVAKRGIAQLLGAALEHLSLKG